MFFPFFRAESHAEEDETGESTDTLGTAPRGIRHKVVVMGAAKVGKSSLITQFLYGTFSDKYKRTVEEMHQGDFCVQGVGLTLDILDTSGAFEFPAMRALSISSADAFILVYSVVDAASFEEARVIREQILETKGGVVPIVVVGNKIDLADEKREVSMEMTESVVTVDWENGFVEASAKENINVTKVFKELLVQAKVKYNLSPALRRKRRQSLPPPQHGSSGGGNPAIPSAAQLAHLRSIQERHTGAGGKRNSCSIS
ncbi:ras-related protein Rap-2a-like [Homalodisca vitripennis]|uniref:ras-related protein Rap-2a-like n=1 Tax=Homalodisca vitripennis TaxID=197043 RepID=UPI001EE9E382|nr:ras-related protein Rap-2a-like [Homalodisca vitripennis]